MKDIVLNDDLLVAYGSHEVLKINDDTSSSEGSSNDESRISRPQNTTTKTVNDRAEGSLRSNLRLLARYLTHFKDKFN